MRLLQIYVKVGAMLLYQDCHTCKSCIIGTVRESNPAELYVIWNKKEKRSDVKKINEKHKPKKIAVWLVNTQKVYKTHTVSELLSVSGGECMACRQMEEDRDEERDGKNSAGFLL